MTQNDRKATIQLVDDNLFLGTSPSGHVIAVDTDHARSSAASPVELLLIALGSCTAVDVIEILRKKRAIVTAYRVEVTGERRADYPRSYTGMDVRHIVSGRNINAKAIAQAIRLSEEKYCSVAATFRPTVTITSTYEIIEETTEETTEANV
ncbi:MAG: OsmC family protein [Pyrinomonadaceae bacterium]